MAFDPAAHQATPFQHGNQLIFFSLPFTRMFQFEGILIAGVLYLWVIPRVYSTFYKVVDARGIYSSVSKSWTLSTYMLNVLV